MTILVGEKNHAAKLLTWYDREARSLPWRYKDSQHNPTQARPQAKPSARTIVNPYHVWLSEVMLQQTTVTAVIPYFNKFLQQWPCIKDLANAPLEEVLTQWAGLGYYARARNLHKCAQVIALDYQGTFPRDEAQLLTLPGIGAYTAAAIAAIAFDQRAVVVDGNVERVVSRIFQVEEPLPKSKGTLKEFAEVLTPKHRAGDYAQAMMDLGARICTPRSPTCLLCPVSAHCKAFASGMAAELPYRVKKAAKPRKEGACFFVVTQAGDILLHKRPDKGLLAKMTQIPTTSWLEDVRSQKALQKEWPFKTSLPLKWTEAEGSVKHVFTHFHLTLQVYVMVIKAEQMSLFITEDTKFYWVKQDKLNKEPLPSLMQKVIKNAQAYLQVESANS